MPDHSSKTTLAWIGRATSPAGLFWLTFVLILLLGAWLRAYRLDLPPVDYPADRQRTNMNAVHALIKDTQILDMRRAFLELWILPWLTARTRWVAGLFNLELWTLARLWSFGFGLCTVAGAAAAGFLAADPQWGLERRRRLALLFMTALAINPYHVFISRMISTESATLALQMAALVCFWMAWRRPRGWRWVGLFVLFFMLAGAAKIPSLIWLPGCFVYFMAQRAYDRRLRIGVFIALLLAVGAVFWVYKLNPFTLYEDYSRRYAWFASQAQGWIGSEPWTRTYLTRLALMLTLPGVLLAAVGLLTAPWLFRITMLTFLVLFYGLVNLNTYNFAHAIIPGMALAAWGVDGLVWMAAASGSSAAGSARLRAALAVGLILLVILVLAPFGPDPARHPQPRADVLRAAEVIRRLAPPGTIVRHDEPEGSLGYLLRQYDDSLSRELDLMTGYYFSFDRFGEQPVRNAARSWVAWASLPGEPRGLLFSREPERQPDAAEFEGFVAVAGVRSDPPLAVEAETFFVPKELYQAAAHEIRVEPGQQLRIGIRWRNPDHARVAGIRWSSSEWRRYIPVPLRAGGFGIQYGGVLCVPPLDQQTAFYTFELPPSLPVGVYYVNYYPLPEVRWTDVERGFAAFPFTIRCEGAGESQRTMARDFAELYPMLLDDDPRLWSAHRWFRNMRVIGYETIEEGNYLLSCPRSEPGIYRLTLGGEALPVPDARDPDALWPELSIFLPEDRQRVAATITLASDRPGRFSAEFVAHAPFDSLLIHVPPARGRQMEKPLWTFDFVPEDFGRQLTRLRSAALELKRPLFSADPNAP